MFIYIDLFNVNVLSCVAQNLVNQKRFKKEETPSPEEMTKIIENVKDENDKELFI